MDKYKDTDLREALNRKYADEPQLPADFMAKMERRMADGSTVPSGSATAAKRARLWRWVAAAACFLVVVGVGLHYQFKEASHPIAQSVTSNQSIGHVQSVNRSRPISQSVTTNQSIGHVQLVNRSRPISQSVTTNHSKVARQSVKSCASIGQSTTLDSDPNLHYASNDLTKDTIPYQDPARVDEFIAKMAKYNKVKESELTCSTPQDSNVMSRVYVFPDKQEIDVFGRLLQVACSYSDATPGYHLYFSHLQFFFELQDVRKHLQYRWIAERVNGKILLYSTNAPLGINTSSACYQEYRDELMNTKIVNTKTKEI